MYPVLPRVQVQGNRSPPKPNQSKSNPTPWSSLLVRFSLSLPLLSVPPLAFAPRPPPTFVLVRASARPSFLLDLSGFLLVYLLPLRPLARVALCQKNTRWSYEHASPLARYFCSSLIALFSSFAPSFLSLLSLLLLLLLLFFFYPPAPRLSFRPTSQLRQALDCSQPRPVSFSLAGSTGASLKPAASIAVLGSQLGPGLFAKARRQLCGRLPVSRRLGTAASTVWPRSFCSYFLLILLLD